MTFQEFMLIINEMKGDFGADAKPPQPKCGWAGKTDYYMGGKKVKVCKFHRKREE
jgi:hypothetical protein